MIESAPLALVPQADLSGPRGIRSWVRREGRITAAQQRALAVERGSRLLVASDAGTIDPVSLGDPGLPLFLEIGCGNGEFLTQLAAQRPDARYLGLEVHRPGLGYGLQRAETLGLANCWFLDGDAAAGLNCLLPDRSLSGCFVFFPDPWPKKRHHKRRLVQAEFLTVLARKCADHARLWLATDWADYAEHMQCVLSDHPAWVNLAGPRGVAPRPAWRPLTRFEARGLRLGHRVTDLLYGRAAPPPAA